MAETNKINFADALKAAGVKDPDEATGLLKAIQQLNKAADFLSLLGIDVKGLLKGLVKKYLAGKVGQEQPVPAPAPAPTPAPAPAPAPGPRPTPDPFEGREISSFHLAPFWYEPRGPGSMVSKAKCLEVMRGGDGGGDPMVPRGRFAVDCDILDQFGREIMAGPKQKAWINENLWFGPNDPEPNTHRMRWFFDGGDGVAHVEESGNGFVPKIKVGKDALPIDNHDYQTGRLYVIFTRKDGVVIQTPYFPSMRAKR